MIATRPSNPRSLMSAPVSMCRSNVGRPDVGVDRSHDGIGRLRPNENRRRASGVDEGRDGGGEDLGVALDVGGDVVR